MDEKRSEELKGALQEFAGVFDAQADEYEQRIAEYEEELTGLIEEGRLKERGEDGERMRSLC